MFLKFYPPFPRKLANFSSTEFPGLFFFFFMNVINTVRGGRLERHRVAGGFAPLVATEQRE